MKGGILREKDEKDGVPMKRGGEKGFLLPYRTRILINNSITRIKNTIKESTETV